MTSTIASTTTKRCHHILRAVYPKIIASRGSFSRDGSCPSSRWQHDLVATMGAKRTHRCYSNSSTPVQKKSGEDHHSFFQEQMMELEREQRQFGPIEHDGANDDGPSFSTTSSASVKTMKAETTELEDQLRDWKNEQVEVFGEFLSDHDHNGSGISASALQKDDDEKEDLEERLLEREARYEFTPEDKAAWGKPQPDPEEMQKILERVAIERKREQEYTESAAAIMSSSQSNSTAKETSQQMPSSVEGHHESFSHVSEDGKGVHMVDVGHKSVTPRTAHARSEVWLPPDVLDAFLPSEENSSELVGPKGPIFATAKISGIMAAKKTSELIPLCHPLPLDQVQLEIHMLPTHDRSTGGTVVIDCTCKVTHKTGVEMEALTGATVAALTIYDMTKAVSHNIQIRDTRLIAKTGGKRTVLDGIENA